MTTKGAKQIRWSIEEDNIIYINRQLVTARELMKLLPGRTWEAVRSRIRHLDIIKETRINTRCSNCDNSISIFACEYRKYASHYCGDDCKAAGFIGGSNPNWKGGISKQHGYTMVKDTSSTITPYKREHRIVMETTLGRELRSDEVVHHINGDKSDNDPRNLKVMTRSEHSKLHWSQGDFNKRGRCK